MGSCCSKWCPCCVCCLQRVSREPRTITPNIAVPPGVKPSNRAHPNHKYMGNKIKTAKYTPWDFVPLNLFKQFHAWTNWYFLVVVVINFIPQINAFGNYLSWVPLAAVLLSTATKDAIEDYQRSKSDHRLNNTSCLVYRNGQYEATTWQTVRPGDILRVQCNEAIPADILVLHSSDPLGVCYVETANLDGETNLKQREVLRCFRDATEFSALTMLPYRVLIEAPNSEVYRINGTFYREVTPDSADLEGVQPSIDISLGEEDLRPGSPQLRNEQVPVNKENVLLRGCKLRNTDYVEGIVMYAGHETKVMMNDDGPRFKRSRLELRIQEDTIFCGILLFILCAGGAIGQIAWLGSLDQIPNVPFLSGLIETETIISQGVITFFIFLIYLQNVIPLPLFVSQELVKILQIVMMENDVEMYDEPSKRKLACRAWNLSEDLGQIEYVFTDKTGTLTENVMTFRRCVVNGSDYTFEDPRLDLHTAPELRIGCSIHQSVTGVAPCPHCNANVPPLLARDADIKRITLESLVENPQIQVGSASSYTPLPVRPSSALASKLNENSMFFLHHFVLMMALCNTVVVSTKNHHEQQTRNDAPKGNSKCTISMPNHSEAKAAETSFTRNSKLDSSGRMSARNSSRKEKDELDLLLESYEAESADELALVKASCVIGCQLLRRTNNRATLKLPGEQSSVDFTVLRILPFDSDRKRMSIIVQHPLNDAIVMYCKGADTSILPLLSRQYANASNPTLVRTKHVIDEYAKLGLRTLCFAKRVLTQAEYERWSEMYEAAERATEDRAKKFFEVAQLIETNFTLLGAVGIEDKLQELVPETIESLRNAGMHVWMLTGDKQETAVNIGFSCRLLDSSQKLLFLNEADVSKTGIKINYYLKGIERVNERRTLRSAEGGSETRLGSAEGGQRSRKLSILKEGNYALIIDGSTLKHVLDDPDNCGDFIKLAGLCKSVLCSRTTPLQKGSIVKLVMEKLGKYSLAIGDGANDVSMIKTANVGIGITGREGLQASMASDYAIAKFKYLKRLLLVHGHWSFHRYAMMALIIFYKQIIWTMVFFWYQLFNGYSAIVMIDQLYQLGYTLIMTALPPIYIGVLDQVARGETLMRDPSLYQMSQKGSYYKPSTFWIYFLDGLYQSVVVFYVAYMVYSDSNFGIWEFGALEYFASVTTVLALCCIETTTWNVLGFISITVSLLGTWLFALIYNAAQGSATAIPPDNPYWVLFNHAQTIEFWTVQVATVVLSVLPRLVFKVVRHYLKPSPMDIAHMEEKRSKVSEGDGFQKQVNEPRTPTIPAQFTWQRLEQCSTPDHLHSPPSTSSLATVNESLSPSTAVDTKPDEPEKIPEVEVKITEDEDQNKSSGTNNPVDATQATRASTSDLSSLGNLPSVTPSRRNNLLPIPLAQSTSVSAKKEADSLDLRRMAVRKSLKHKKHRKNRVGTLSEEPEETRDNLAEKVEPNAQTE